MNDHVEEFLWPLMWHFGVIRETRDSKSHEERKRKTPPGTVCRWVIPLVTLVHARVDGGRMARELVSQRRGAPEGVAVALGAARRVDQAVRLLVVEQRGQVAWPVPRGRKVAMELQRAARKPEKGEGETRQNGGESLSSLRGRR